MQYVKGICEATARPPLKIATGEEPEALDDDGKDKAAVSLGRRGGKARAEARLGTIVEACEPLGALARDRIAERLVLDALHVRRLGKVLPSKALAIARMRRAALGTRSIRTRHRSVTGS